MSALHDSSQNWWIDLPWLRLWLLTRMLWSRGKRNLCFRIYWGAHWLQMGLLCWNILENWFLLSLYLLDCFQSLCQPNLHRGNKRRRIGAYLVTYFDPFHDLSILLRPCINDPPRSYWLFRRILELQWYVIHLIGHNCSRPLEIWLRLTRWLCLQSSSINYCNLFYHQDILLFENL